MVFSIADFENYAKSEGFSHIEDNHYVKHINDNLKLDISYCSEKGKLSFLAIFYYKEDMNSDGYNFQHGAYSCELLQAIEKAKYGIQQFVGNLAFIPDSKISTLEDFQSFVNKYSFKQVEMKYYEKLFGSDNHLCLGVHCHKTSTEGEVRFTAIMGYKPDIECEDIELCGDCSSNNLNDAILGAKNNFTKNLKTYIQDVEDFDII